MITIDRATYDDLHPSDRLALHFHAVLAAPEDDARRARIGRLDDWVAGLAPRFDNDAIDALLAVCGGTPLEPMRLRRDARELSVRFVQIVFSEHVGGTRARIVSEDTLGISGGLNFRRDMTTHFLERRRGRSGNPGARRDWYFAPASLRDPAMLEQALQGPIRVSVRPSAEHGFVLVVSVPEPARLGWEAGGLSALARDLEKHSTLGDNRVSLGSILSQVSDRKSRAHGAALCWAPGNPEAIVRFSALIAGGHTLTLDPGRRYSRRVTATAALALPGDGPVDLEVRLRQALPRLTHGLWAGLPADVPPLPWGQPFGVMAEAVQRPRWTRIVENPPR